ncbi:LADA_0F10968g1_1 [Lachancea dasiensis]|uniref:LADA_0F10968g1_1 n=1 Tax=Lachancea dasiensis TaxID=1072105 RepID=A0A1G4JLW5_9SACH|nr:LADA_0F10968g1_1 [Lachancea dasiensis]
MLQFAVSLEGNDSAADFRIVEYENGKLNIKKMYIQPNHATGGQTTVLCYLRPRGQWSYDPVDSKRETFFDHSDYLLISHGHGFIAVHDKVSSKIAGKEVLRASWYLSCGTSPGNADVQSRIISMEYQDGILYCLMDNSTVCLFILNLPPGYVKTDDIISSQGAEKWEHWQHFARPNPEDLTEENRQFFKEVSYIGRDASTHIFSFLAPAHWCYRQLLHDRYGGEEGVACFQPSFTVDLAEGVGKLRINPIDPLSFIVAESGTQLTIQRIIISRSFLLYLSILKAIIEDRASTREADLWCLCSMEENEELKIVSEPDHLHYILDELYYDSGGPMSNGEAQRWDLRQRGGVPKLLSVQCWRQKRQLQSEVQANMLLSSADQILYCPDRPVLKRRRAIKVKQRQRRVGKLQHNLAKSTAERFIKNIKFPKHSSCRGRHQALAIDKTVVDFRVAHSKTKRLNMISDVSRPLPFLSDFYPNLSIMSIDRRLTLEGFRPSFSQRPFLQYDATANKAFRYVHNSLTKGSEYLSCSNPLERLYVLNENLSLLLNPNGLLLFILPPTQTGYSDKVWLLSKKVLPFSLGIIHNAVLILKYIKSCTGCKKCRGDTSVELEIVASSTDQIFLLGVRFKLHSNIGSVTLLDCLSLTLQERALGSITFMGSSDATQMLPI